MVKKEYQLYDAKAQELFQEFKGIDHSDRTLGPAQMPIKPKEGVQGVLSQLDMQKIHMVDLMFHLSAYIGDPEHAAETPDENQSFFAFSKMLKQIANWPGHDGQIVVRYRGMGHFSTMEFDYVVYCGTIRTDLDIIAGLKQAPGASGRRLSEKLGDAFRCFSEKGINTIYIKIPGNADVQSMWLREGLRFFAGYFQHYKPGMTQKIAQKATNFPFVFNENFLPDPNLTLLAHQNPLEVSQFQELVEKVKTVLKSHPTAHVTNQYINVYEALFSIKNFPVKLVRPLIEINNPRWLVTDKDQKTISQEVSQAIQMVSETLGEMTPETARAIESVYSEEKTYGNEFQKVEVQEIEYRLKDADKLLAMAEKTPQGKKIEKDIFVNVDKRLSQMHDDSLAELFDAGPEPESRKPENGKEESGKKEADKKEIKPIDSSRFFYGVENIRLKKLIHYHKERHNTRKKIKAMLGPKVRFTDKDYAIIAREFKYSKEEVRDLLEILKGCFDPKGRFRKKEFEKSVDWLVQYEKNVFEFLWHYLKASKLSRTDRVSFLNSLQAFINQMKQRNVAVRTLLSDIFRHPTVVDFSDRNALMLANMLVRKYNKEMNLDIELTPEEVLLVENGLDIDVAGEASRMIDENQEIFLIKTLTIQKRIKEALESANAVSGDLSVKYLLSLEKELYTFLSLVGGYTATAIMRIAITEYGNPEAAIYRLKQSSKNLTALFQRLRVVVRGFGRIGSEDDLGILNDIKNNEYTFKKMEGNGKMMQAILEFVDISIRQIHRRMVR